MTPARRPGRRSARYLSVAALCAVTAAGCGSGSSHGAAAGPATTKPAAAQVSLSITTGSSSSRPKTSTLRCDPPGGTHSDPAAACKVLLAAKNPFGPPPKGMCPMIVAGSEKAVITGTYFGKKVNVTMFDGGCWIGRWHEVGQIFN